MGDGLRATLAKLASPEVSPGLADSKGLRGLPKAYFVVSGFDLLKDDGLLYAERLRRAGVDTRVKYYESSFHGVSQNVGRVYGARVARDMLADLVEEIRSVV